MTEQTQPLNLRAKLSAVYARVDHIEKTGRNAKQNYDYVRSADVLHAIRKALAEFRVYAETNFDLLSTYDIKTNSGGNMHTATVKAYVVFHDVDSEEKITSSGLGDGADGGDKGIYKAQTGAIKNALRNAFLVPDAADPEADQSVDEAVQEPKVAQNAKITRQNVIAETIMIHEENNNIVAHIPVELATASGPLPTPEQFDVYTARLRNLREKLQTEGKLKPSAGLPAARKMLNYIKKVTGQEDLKQVSTVQFDSFFQFAEKMAPEDLVKLIQDANTKGGK